jgi:hypothetical protein
LGIYTAGTGHDVFIYHSASDSPFTAGSGGSSDDLIDDAFKPSGSDKINLAAVHLIQKAVLDKGIVPSFTDAVTPGFFSTASVAVEYGPSNTAHAYVDANNNGNLDSGDLLIKFADVAGHSLGSTSFLT